MGSTSPWANCRSELLESAALRQSLAARLHQQRRRLAEAAGRLGNSSLGRPHAQAELAVLSLALEVLTQPAGAIPETLPRSAEQRVTREEAALLQELAQPEPVA
ncbi:MAG: hypothetical protein VKI83_06635 [Synechococcaceae cyanobacterium]|nr:hypothetical protein [Synechococcaceae cyanobacterium]